MESLFTEWGIRASDFIQISATFFFTLLVYFKLRDKKFLWLNRLLLIAFTLECEFMMSFRTELNTKAFAGLMLLSVIIAETAVIKKN